MLICHRGALGDFVLTWPALSQLRKVLPNIQFLGVGRPEYMRLATKLGILDNYKDAESSSLIPFFSGREIPKVLGSPEGAILWLSEGEAVADLLRRNAKLPVVLIAPFPAEKIHVAEYHYQAISGYFFIKNGLKGPSVYFPLNTKMAGYALIHPGSGSSSKNFSPKFYKDLAELVRHSGLSDIRFIIGPYEEKELVRSLLGERVERPKNLESLAYMQAGASLYIGNDSGTTHLAGVLGTSTIALYRTTDPDIWGVIGRYVTNIRASDEKKALEKIGQCLRDIRIRH